MPIESRDSERRSDPWSEAPSGGFEQLLTGNSRHVKDPAPINGPIGLTLPTPERSEKGQEMLDKLEGDEYAPYMDGKPSLVTIDAPISQDDIEYVSDEYVGGGGIVLSYWFDMLEVRTKSGDKFLVQKDITPELYEQVKSKMEDGDAESLDDDYAWSSADVPKDDKSWLDRKKNQGFEVITPDSEITLPTGLNDLEYSEFGGGSDDFHSGVQITVDDIDAFSTEGGTLIYKDSDGKRYAVSEEYTPEVYQQIKNLKDTWDGIEEKVDSDEYELLNGSDDIPVLSGDDEVENVTDEKGKLVEGVKLIHKDGETLVVLESRTPQHYETITDYAADKYRGEADDPFRDRDLPLASETDLMEAETTVEEDGESLSVGELFMQNLKDKRDDTDDKELQDKLDKYIRLMELKSDLKNGIEILPYQVVNIAGGDRSDYAESTQMMSESDVRGLVDEQALSEELEGLLSDEDFAALSEEMMSDATDKLKDKDALVDKIYSSMTGEEGDEYLLAINDLDDDGLKQQAQNRMHNDLSVLATLDPEKAEEAQNQITAKSLTMDVGGAMDEIDDEYGSGDISAESEDRAEQVASDLVKPMLTGIIYSNFGLQASTRVWQAIDSLKAGDDGKPAGFDKLTDEEKEQFNKIKIVKDVLKDALKEEALKGTKAGKLDFGDISDRVDNAVRDAGLKDSSRITKELKSGFKTFIDREATFAIGGLVALANAIYRRSGDDFGDSPEERMAVARGILVFIGCTPGTLNTLDYMGNGFKSLFGQKGMIEALGLDKELYDTYKKNTGTKEEFVPDERVEARQKIDKGWSELSALMEIKEDLSDEQKEKVQDAVDKIQDGISEERALIENDPDLTDEQKQQQLDRRDEIDKRMDEVSEDVSNGKDSEAQKAFTEADERRQFHLKAIELHDDSLVKQAKVEQILSAAELKGGFSESEKSQVESLLKDLKKGNSELRDLYENDSNLSDADRKFFLDGMDEKSKLTNELIDDINTADNSFKNSQELFDDLQSQTTGDIRDLDPLSDTASRSSGGGDHVYDGFNQALDNAGAAGRGDQFAMSGALPPGTHIPEVENIEGINGDVRRTSTPTDTDKVNLFGPALKGIGYMTNFGGGILDVAVAGMGLDAALQNGDAMDKANASLGIVSGAGFTAAGAAEIAGSTISPGARFAPLRALGAVSRLGVVPGLNVVGVAVGAVSLILGLVISQQKNREKEKEVLGDFQDLDSYGVMEDDWGEKLNFLIHSAAAFEGEEGAGDAPENIYYDDGFYQDNKEIIDYIADHWDRDTPGDYKIDDGDSGDGGGGSSGLGGRLGLSDDPGSGMPEYGWTWSGADDLVSKKDLERVVDKKIGTEMDQKAAQFLLDNEGFFDLLDTFHNGGKADDKASTADIDSWLQFIGKRPETEDNPIFEREEPSPLYEEFFSKDVPVWEAQPELYEAFTEEVSENGNIPENFFENHLDEVELQVHGEEFFENNKEEISTIAENWNDWNGGDDIVSKDNLKKIRDDGDRSDAERGAAEFLLEHEEFFDLLDTFHKQDDSDNKISDADLDSWFQIIGERPITEENPVFEIEGDPLDGWLTDHKGP
ncbi:hypothetical protein AAGT95_04785 [Salinicola lusitanus]|uniref:Uncharacterized protein n=1 Tax=Salinicola lusitanus TaxID=1949085 RepID=A0ABZ3CVY1_9GAMM